MGNARNMANVMQQRGIKKMTYHNELDGGQRLINKFGSGIIYDSIDVKGSIYATCAACMSIYAEFLSWANDNEDRFVNNPIYASSIIILSCQVTDLAVLNDLRCLEKLMNNYPDKTYYIGGCLARRFDIDLPKNVRRLDNIKIDYKPLNKTWMLNYEYPFWVDNFSEDSPDKLSDGHLFRNMYPLRIGTGCSGKCKYCTIRVTRSEHSELDISWSEFCNFKNPVLIADSPSKELILKWCNAAILTQKQISIRNIEPHVAILCSNELLTLSEKRLLKIFHCPIQSDNPATLKDMHREINSTLSVIDLVYELKKRDTICATNVIIDYKNFENPDMYTLQSVFDYISWNPYWDGIWDRAKAEIRFKKYLT
ncbi:MAG: hypothetical protein ACFFDN_23005 [Candidatus Hodarchaeota archaeon]